MCASSQPDLACFVKDAQKAVEELRARLCPNDAKLTKAECEQVVNELIARSRDSWRTYVYDEYQFCCQGIF
jgi:phosphoenolpyruvate carboxylase